MIYKCLICTYEWKRTWYDFFVPKCKNCESRNYVCKKEPKKRKKLFKNF